MIFHINDLIYIIPTGDPEIDRFLDQQMTIVKIEKTQADRYTSYLFYTVQSPEGNRTTVLECEMEYRNNG